MGDVTVDDEVASLIMERPHVVLLGAGASKAALPDGDKHGKPLPLMRDVTEDLALADLFPGDLQALASDDFEAAYFELVERGDPSVAELDDRIANYFGWL